MGEILKYSAGLVSNAFWFLESKKTAKLMLEGKTRKEIYEFAVENNIYQLETKNRIKRVCNMTYRRLNHFSFDFLRVFLNLDVNSAKIFVLVSILADDKLFFEFMYEVFRDKIILGDFSLNYKDFDMFFENKINQSNEVGKWTETTRKKLKSVYRRILSEAGVIRKNMDGWDIIIPFIDLNLHQKLVDEGFGPILYSITGEK